MSKIDPSRSFPWAPVMACVALVLGAGLAVGGIYLLAGLGWAMLAGALPCFLLAAIILRGLSRG